jgi:hypothetical protein
MRVLWDGFDSIDEVSSRGSNMSRLSDVRIDKTAVQVFNSFDEADAQDKAHRLAKTPLERLAACEQLRQISYGYDPATARLPRSLEILERATG